MNLFMLADWLPSIPIRSLRNYSIVFSPARAPAPKFSRIGVSVFTRTRGGPWPEPLAWKHSGQEGFLEPREDSILSAQGTKAQGLRK